MTDSINRTRQLTRVIQNSRVPPMHLQRRYFSRTDRSTRANYIVWDEEKIDLRITPYSAVDAEATIVEAVGFDTKSVRTPYMSEKTEFNPVDQLDRDLGEDLNGTLTPDQRLRRRMGRELAGKRLRFERGKEVSCAEILKTGKLVVVGKKYPRYEMDFLRPANQSNWNPTVPWTTSATATPRRDMMTMAQIVSARTGISPREAFMPLSTYITLTETQEFKDSVDFRRIVQSDMQMGPIAQDEGQAIYQGTWGNFDLWTYDFPYTDWEGNAQQAFVDGDFIMMGDVEGSVQYSPILDSHFNFAPIGYAARTWTDDDPAVDWLLGRAACVPLPYRVDASLHADVNTAA